MPPSSKSTWQSSASIAGATANPPTTKPSAAMRSMLPPERILPAAAAAPAAAVGEARTARVAGRRGRGGDGLAERRDRAREVAHGEARWAVSAEIPARHRLGERGAAERDSETVGPGPLDVERHRIGQEPGELLRRFRRRLLAREVVALRDAQVLAQAVDLVLEAAARRGVGGQPAVRRGQSAADQHADERDGRDRGIHDEHGAEGRCAEEQADGKGPRVPAEGALLVKEPELPLVIRARGLHLLVVGLADQLVAG